MAVSHLSLTHRVEPVGTERGRGVGGVEQYGEARRCAGVGLRCAGEERGDARFYARFGQENFQREEDGTFTKLEPSFGNLVLYPCASG